MSWLLAVRLVTAGGGEVPSVVPRLRAAGPKLVQVLVSLSPPLVPVLSRPRATDRSCLFLSRVLPAFIFEMVQVVLSLLLVSPGNVECSDGLVRLPAKLLNEISGDQIARPVEAVGAVDSYQTSLSLGLQDGGVESLHAGLAGDGAVAFHPDLDVTPAKLLAVSWSVVAVGVGQVHDMFQLRSGLLQLM